MSDEEPTIGCPACGYRCGCCCHCECQTPCPTPDQDGDCPGHEDQNYEDCHGGHKPLECAEWTTRYRALQNMKRGSDSKPQDLLIREMY